MGGAFFVSAATLSAFVAASVLLAVTPGPAVIYIVARSLAQGRRAGLVSVAAVALGNLGNALGASLGLAALFALSSAAFTVVKLAGAGYLVYLGIEVLRRPPDAVGAPEFRAAPLRRIFRDGFVVALLNPKTAIFFAAFLPQFVDPSSAPAAQSVVFGAAFVGVAAVTDTIYVLTASAAAAALAGSARVRAAGRYASAATFIGLGLVTALTGSRSTR